jgi:hypothetical protein
VLTHIWLATLTAEAVVACAWDFQVCAGNEMKLADWAEVVCRCVGSLHIQRPVEYSRLVYLLMCSQ